ncbi:MAG: MFS transporter [Armatimonadota bacterium]
MPSEDRLTNLRALTTANWDLAFATAFAALVGGNFQAAFALALGAGPFLYSLILALPALIGILQIPGSQLGERSRSYKRFVGPGWLTWKLAWLPAIALPLLPESFPRLEVFILCVVVSSAAVFLVNATYNAWLSWLVPESHRGWYFARRHAIATVVGVLIGFPASLGLDAMQRANRYDLGLSIIFAAGVLFGMLSFLFFVRMPDARREQVSSGSLKESWKDLSSPLSHRPFRRLLVFLIVFLVGQAIAAPFFFKYGREVLSLSFFDFQIFAAAHALATLLSAPLWGYLSDRYGNKPVLFISGLLLALGPLSWVIAQPGATAWNYAVLIIGHVSAGFSWTGVVVGQGNLVLAVTPASMRAQGIGLSQAVMTLVGGLAPLAGGVFMQLAQSLPLKLQYDILFTANSALRIFAILFLFGVHDPTSMRIREFLLQVWGVRPRGVLALRRLAQTPEPRRREEALRELVRARMRFAERELISLLNDPSPSVRRLATQGLREVGGPSALDALLEFARSHPHLIEEEALEAIAAIGDERAVPTLSDLLLDEGFPLRSACARALGELRSAQAVPALQLAAKDEDAELRYAALHALGEIGDRECAPIVLGALDDRSPSVRLAAAQACASLALSEAAPRLRVAVSEATDETLPEIAYALAVCGDRSDLEAILWAASRARSQLGRRRCLLGAGRLLQVEEELYRYLLLDPVALDRELMRRAASGPPAMEAALRAHHGGEEQEAIHLLAESTGDDDLRVLAGIPIPEAYLLAVCLAAKRQ